MRFESWKWILGPTRHNGAKTKGCLRHFLTCVAEHANNTPRWTRWTKAPIPVDDIAAIPNEAVVYVSGENHWNTLREAKHQRVLLKCVGALAIQEDRI